MRGLWSIVWRTIWARRVRSIFTAAAVALGIAVILSVQMVLSGLDAEAAAAQALRAGSSGIDVRVNGGGNIDDLEIAILSNIQGVSEAVPLYEKRVIARSGTNDIDGVTVTLVGVRNHLSGLRTVLLTAGRLPDTGSRTEIAVDGDLAQVLSQHSHTQIGVGSDIELTTSTGPDTYHIVGITAGTSGGAAFTRSAIFVSQTAMTSTFALGLRTPMVALRLTPNADLNALATAVHKALGNAVTVVDPRDGAVSPIAQVRPLLLLLTALSLLVGAGVTANSTSLAAVERRREIGLLRAAGASQVQVTRMLLAEAALVCLVAIPFGVVAGLGIGALMNNAFASPDFVGNLNVSLEIVLMAIAIGFGSGVIGAAIPAFLAGRTAILDGLRPAAAAPRERIPWRLVASAPVAFVLAAICFLDGSGGLVVLGGVLLLLGIVATLPASTPLLLRGLARVVSPLLRQAPVAAANLGRRRNRTALTSAGLCVSIAAAVATAGLAAGAGSASDAWIHHLFIGNAVVRSPITQSDAVARQIAGSSGVVSVSPIRIISAPVGGDVFGIAAIDPAAYIKAGGLDIQSGGRDAALAALADTPSVLVPAQLALTNGWQVGTPLTADTSKGSTILRISGIIAHSFPAGDGRETIVMGSSIAVGVFGQTASGFDDLMVTTRQEDLSSLRSAAASYGLSAVAVTDIQDSSRRALAHSIGLLQAIAAIALVIALLAVANTLAVNVRQGTRDLALMRAVGLSRRRALRLVLIEAGLLAVVGCMVGVAAGALLTLPMLQASSTVGFQPTFNLPVANAVALALGVLLVTVLAAILPARRAVTASIVSAIRYE